MDVYRITLSSAVGDAARRAAGASVSTLLDNLEAARTPLRAIAVSPCIFGGHPASSAACGEGVGCLFE